MNLDQQYKIKKTLYYKSHINNQPKIRFARVIMICWKFLKNRQMGRK